MPVKERGDSTLFGTWRCPVLRLASLPLRRFLLGHFLAQSFLLLLLVWCSEWQTRKPPASLGSSTVSSSSVLLLLLPAVQLLLPAPAAHIWATAPSPQ